MSEGRKIIEPKICMECGKAIETGESCTEHRGGFLHAGLDKTCWQDDEKRQWEIVMHLQQKQDEEEYFDRMRREEAEE
jgi:hypothetical protein